jgi:hypothetical protein
MTTRVKFPLSVLAVVIAGLVLASAAAASCNPGRSSSSGYWWDNWDVGPTETTCLNGSYANIENHSPYVQSGVTEDFSMLVNVSVGGYGSVGWDKHSDNSRFNFIEYDDSDTGWNTVRKEYSASAVGNAPQYKVNYSANAFHFFIAGTNDLNFTSPNYTGCSAEQGGQIQNFNSQMPGEVGTHDPLTDAHVRTASNNTWIQTSLWAPFSSNSSYFGNSTSGNPLSELDIWDKSC